METFSELKEFVKSPDYREHRKNVLRGLTDDMIDPPILGLIKKMNELPYCFTLQCCYGHFVYKGRLDPRNCNPLPVKTVVNPIEYRIAYIAVCIENSFPGRKLYESLSKIPDIDPDNIQFCCAEWFWKRDVNSYALQVEPDRFKRQDTAMLGYTEALHIERVRKEFFNRLYALFGVITIKNRG